MKQTTLTLLFFGITIATTVTNVYAADPAAGQTKAAICSACHGAKGISSNPEWPNLAGQQETYLRKQITAFRDGGRTNALMAPMVANLSDTDIANLAAYYAGLK